MITPGNIKPRFVRSLPAKNRFLETWNKVVIDFLASGDEWLLSTHNDVVFVPETLTRLLSWNKPLISALIFMRTSPAMPHIWKDYEEKQGHYAPRIKDTRKWFYEHPDCIKNFGPYVMEERPSDALTPASFTSTSCMLIHRSVLEDMHKICNDAYFLQDTDEGSGEDRRFCELALQAGYETFVDRSCVVGHLVGDTPTSAADFFAWDYVSTVLNTGEHEIIK
jgi:hypothetical protein